MKTMRKLLSLMLAVSMVAAMAVAAFAAEERPLPITIKNSLTNRKYYAYQVFAGTINDKGVMANIKWGDCVDYTRDGSSNGIYDIYEDLATNDKFKKNGSNQFASVDSAEDVANVMAKWSYNEAYAKAFADVINKYLTETKRVESSDQSGGVYTINVTKPGYYIIKEVAIDGGISGAEAYTDYLLNISGATNIEPKTSEPSLLLQVNYMPDATYVEATDLQVGARAYYKAEVKMPKLINDYKQFHLHVDIELPAGLEMVQDLNEGTNKIYVQHASGSQTEMKREDDPNRGTNKTYKIDFEGNGAEVDFGDIIDKFGTSIGPDDVIVLKYAATVNSNAILVKDANDVARNGNVASVTAKFSNDMNEEPKADIHSVRLGQLTDTANVYTYQVEFKKVDSLTKAALAGAEFRLFRDVTENYTEVVDGTTVNKERVVRYYAVANSVTNSEGVQEATITSWSTDVDAAATFVSSSSSSMGKFIVKGLDSLTYELEETKAPSGYNDMLETVKVAITAKIPADKVTELSCLADGGNYTADAENLNIGRVEATINNTPGSTLPATGGMGTTIFYVIGAMLLLGSSVIFIMKKRNEA